MRRNECEILEPERIDELINSCSCCRLGLVDGDKPYIVPLNFGYVRQGEKRFFYFHGAKEGRKMDLVRQNRCAGFELDTDHRLRQGETACSYSFGYRSVIGAGTVREVTDRGEKRRALACIMAHYSDRTDWEFPDAALDKTAVIALEVEELSAKERV